MVFDKRAAKLRRRIAGVLLGGGMSLGFVESCDDRLIQVTRFFDPCGTILANCLPGQLAAQQAPTGDSCFLCSRPGTCDGDQPFLNICD